MDARRADGARPLRTPEDSSGVSVLLNDRETHGFLPCNLGHSGDSHSRIIGLEETSESILSSFKTNIGFSRREPLLCH